MSKLISAKQVEDIILQAMDHWEDLTCLKFEKVEKGLNEPHVIFTHDTTEGCYSESIGMNPYENGQLVNIDMKNCKTMGDAAHEIGHVIGFFHEHSRPDRDRHVNITYDKNNPDSVTNFAKEHNILTYDLPYDLSSIMHYTLGFYEKGSHIALIDPTQKITPEQNLRLSDLDIKRLKGCITVLESGTVRCRERDLDGGDLIMDGNMLVLPFPIITAII